MKVISILLVTVSLLFSNYSQNVTIIVDPNADFIKKFAANELKKHLELVLDKKVLISSLKTDGKYVFYIGKTPKKNFKIDSMSNYLIEDNKVYLYGIDEIMKKKNTELETVLFMRNKVGTLFSVYDFLYNELGIRWVKPKDEGIIYKKIKNLKLINKSFSWNSNYNFTVFRNDIWRYNKLVKKLQMNKYTPKELIYSKSDVIKYMQDDLLWKRRMKLHISSKPSYGHAFRKFWNKYGEKKPEWFSLSESNKRGVEGFPLLDASRQKFCISNENLQNQIVENWRKVYTQYNRNIYNATINDSRGYCTCEFCRLHDSEDDRYKDFQKKSKTDRYIFFWNRLLEKSKKFNPDSKLIAYAYSDYRYPPTKKILKDDIILGFVPKFGDLPKEIKKDLDEWKKKGLKKVFIRPNDFNDDIGLPMGHEKYIYDRFKVFNNTNILGLDYDSSYNFDDWSFSGITRYILIQSFNNPNKSFEELENEYYKIFGSSKVYIKKYYKYWRNNFEQKRLKYIKRAAGFKGKRFLYRNLKDFFSIKDFEKTNEFLISALKNVKSTKIKKLIEDIIISNNHAKLIFEVYSQKTNIDVLLAYRIKNKKNLSLCWPQVFITEERFNRSLYKRIYLKLFN